MAGPINFKLNPEVLVWARTSMGLTLEQAASKAGISVDQYNSWEEGLAVPTYKQLETLCERVYKRSIAIIMMPVPIEEEPIESDFRNITRAEAEKVGFETRLALRKARKYQIILEEVATLVFPNIGDFDASANPVETAARFREFINLNDEEQFKWKHSNALSQLRRKIEATGIYTFISKMPFEEARAFCLTGKFPVIILNGNDSENGRIFSLLHECAHILLNVSGLFKDKIKETVVKEYKEIEDYCDSFAASVLVPDKAFAFVLSNYESKNFTEGIISRIAEQFNVSREVIARKLVSIDYLQEPVFYSLKNKWDAQARKRKQEQNELLKSKDSGRNQGIVVVREKGFAYVSQILAAFRRGDISTADLSQYLETRLKNIPKVIARLNG